MATDVPATDAFEMFISEEKGRGLRSCKKCVIPQSTLLISSEPFVYVLDKTQKGTRCDHCFKKPPELLRCSQCKQMRYCDKLCQKGSWSQHKKECEALKRVAPKVPPDFVFLLSRVLWKLESSMDNNRPEDLVSIMELESNYEKLTDDQKEILGKFVVTLHLYWGQGSLPMQTPDIKAVLELCSKLKNNCFSISDEEFQNIGTGVYLSCSLLNHDCNPNCIAVFEGLKLNIRALRDISPQEELTISYVDQLAPSFDRQNELESQYGFKCNCKHCQDGTMDSKMLITFKHGDSEENLRRIKSLVQQLDDLMKVRNYEEIDKLTLMYTSAKLFPVQNVYMTKVLDCTADVCINLGKYDKAVQYGKIVLQSYERYLQRNHPLIGMQAMRVGKLQLYLGAFTEAKQYLLKANDILQISYGSNSPLLNELSVAIEQCRVEMNLQSSKEQ